MIDEQWSTVMQPLYIMCSIISFTIRQLEASEPVSTHTPDALHKIICFDGYRQTPAGSVISPAELPNMILWDNTSAVNYKSKNRSFEVELFIPEHLSAGCPFPPYRREQNAKHKPSNVTGSIKHVISPQRLIESIAP